MIRATHLKKLKYIGPLMLGSVAAGVSLLAQAADEAAIQRGQTLYQQNMCYTCHGTQGQGGERNAGPRIAPNPFPLPAFEMQLRQPRGVMPRYSAQSIGDQGVKDLHAFVSSMPAPQPVSSIPLLRDAMK